ncbi:uncharacterized protein LOC123563442 [Mercenaria mercenaria]|uniref:uncharacterized protein LOC123563442 n=1 Tax=Mercenaria mercenaria TaxID=6596 RepID=UPI00234F5133|nr:uncharacterized protein LOC123563442 [Mercenaria mercenaria]
MKRVTKWKEWICTSICSALNIVGEAGFGGFAPLASPGTSQAVENDQLVGVFTSNVVSALSQEANDQSGGSHLVPVAATTYSIQPVDQDPEGNVITTSVTLKTVSVKCKLENLPAIVTVGSDSSTANILLEPLDGLAISGNRRSDEKNMSEYGNTILAAERI